MKTGNFYRNFEVLTNTIFYVIRDFSQMFINNDIIFPTKPKKG